MDLLNSKVSLKLAFDAMIFLVFAPLPLLIADMFSVNINLAGKNRRAELGWELVSIAKCSHCVGFGYGHSLKM